MEPETIQVIKHLIDDELIRARNKMMTSIEYDNDDARLKNDINAYRAILRVRNDFQDWLEDQDE